MLSLYSMSVLIGLLAINGVSPQSSPQPITSAPPSGVSTSAAQPGVNSSSTVITTTGPSGVSPTANGSAINTTTGQSGVSPTTLGSAVNTSATQTSVGTSSSSPAVNVTVGTVGHTNTTSTKHPKPDNTMLLTILIVVIVIVVIVVCICITCCCCYRSKRKQKSNREKAVKEELTPEEKPSAEPKGGAKDVDNKKSDETVRSMDSTGSGYYQELMKKQHKVKSVSQYGGVK